MHRLPRRAVSRSLGLSIVCLLGANGWAFAVVSNRVTPISVASAVERSRETTLSSTSSEGSAGAGSPAGAQVALAARRG